MTDDALAVIDQAVLEDVWAGRLTVNRAQLRFDHPLCIGCEQ